MSSFADNLENAVLNLALNQTAYVLHTPGTQYLALYTVAPTDSTQGTEVSAAGTNYSRQAITFAAASGRSIANDAACVFTCAGAPFGTIVAQAICVSGTAGTNDHIAWDTVTNKAVIAGETYTAAISGVTISFTASGAGGGMKTTFCTALLNYLFRGTAWAGTYATIGAQDPRFALYTTTPSDAAAGTEVSTGGYGRVDAGFDAAAAGVSSNTDIETWTAAGGDFGVVTGMAVCVTTTEADDSIMWWGDLDSDANVLDGDTIQFIASAVDVTLT